MAALEGLITVAEAANLLDLDKSWVLRLIQAGKLNPADKLPGETGAYLLDRVEVERYAGSRPREDA